MIDVRFPGEIREAFRHPQKLVKADMDQKQFEQGFDLLEVEFEGPRQGKKQQHFCQGSLIPRENKLPGVLRE